MSILHFLRFLLVKREYIEAKKRGVRILYITEITKDNMPYCKEIMQLVELRHLDAISGNFAVSDAEYVAGIKHNLDGNKVESLMRIAANSQKFDKA